jgi:hypothetical protein
VQGSLRKEWYGPRTHSGHAKAKHQSGLRESHTADLGAEG